MDKKIHWKWDGTNVVIGDSTFRAALTSVEDVQRMTAALAEAQDVDAVLAAAWVALASGTADTYEDAGRKIRQLRIERIQARASLERSARAVASSFEPKGLDRLFVAQPGRIEDFAVDALRVLSDAAQEEGEPKKTEADGA